MAIKIYSFKRDGNKKLSDNFSVREFRCPDGTDTILISEELVVLLEKLRAVFGKPIDISSGYRTLKYNARLGNSSGSQHILGTAADIHISGVDPKLVAAEAEKLMPKGGGIGLYTYGFTHIDVRGSGLRSRARWQQDTKNGKAHNVKGFYEKGELAMSEDKVRELQMALEKAGLYTAGVDGDWGELSQEAFDAALASTAKLEAVRKLVK